MTVPFISAWERSADAWWEQISTRLRWNTIGTVVAVVGVVVAVVGVASLVSHAEIDLTRLSPTGEQIGSGTPRLILEGGRVSNTGNATARNVEIVRPRYNSIGNVSPGEGFTAPSRNFSVRYEWGSLAQPRTEVKQFNVEEERPAGGSTSAAKAEIEPTPPVPDGLVATYDPATHLLTVTAGKPIEVRVDGFLLRPISKTSNEGEGYRYTPANILVLGQDLKEGQRVEFEVVFTKPQDYYSIPIYVREAGEKEWTYFTVSAHSTPEEG